MFQCDLLFPWITISRKVLREELLDSLIQTRDVPFTERDADECGHDAFRNRFHIDVILSSALMVVVFKNGSIMVDDQNAEQCWEGFCNVLVDLPQDSWVHLPSFWGTCFPAIHQPAIPLHGSILLVGQDPQTNEYAFLHIPRKLDTKKYSHQDEH